MTDWELLDTIKKYNDEYIACMTPPWFKDAKVEQLDLIARILLNMQQDLREIKDKITYDDRSLPSPEELGLDMEDDE